MNEQNYEDVVLMNNGEIHEMTVRRNKTGMATASLVLGIIAFITTLLLVNYILGLIALILGIIFLVKKGNTTGKGRAGVGIGLAVTSMVLSTVIWVNLYSYLTTTPILDILEDVAELTGGAFDPEEVVNETIENYVYDVLDEKTIESVEKILGDELNYNTLVDFVGEDLTVEDIDHFIGDSDIDGDEIEELMAEVDTKAVTNDLGGKVTYEALEDELGRNFTYEELIEYLEDFKK